MRECCLCEDKKKSLLSIRDRKGNYLRTIACQGCGLVHHDPLPTDQEITLYYKKNYRLDYKHTYLPKPKHIYRAGRIALERINRLTPWLSPNSRILDVGSGSGELCYLLNTHGYHAAGIEPNDGYGAYSRDKLRLNIHLGSFATASYPPESFHLITMFHVLEHILHPVTLLQQVHRWMRPEGFLIVEVPNVEATCVTPKNRFHFAHIYNFNILTLEFIGIKCGFSVVNSYTSQDTEIIRVVFQKSCNLTVLASAKDLLANNCQRIKTCLNNHTTAKHYFSRVPYLRLLQKGRRGILEKLNTFNRKNGLEILHGLMPSHDPVANLSSPK